MEVLMEHSEAVSRDCRCRYKQLGPREEGDRCHSGLSPAWEVPFKWTQKHGAGPYSRPCGKANLCC